jgi:hypothetical protein
MAFLDNSGDIILDAVLTDTGRQRLARGDGSFKIVKFALGDDEINYEAYNKNHPSGSAYYDLEVLQTPVLEAFTNNTSLMKSKLISIPRTNLLYLPILKVNTVYDPSNKQYASTGLYYVAVDKATEQAAGIDVSGARVDGVVSGENVPQGARIRLDQGLNTTEISPSFPLDADLVETQYIIEMDNRLGQICNVTKGRQARVSFIDDDNIASYFLSLGTDRDYVTTITETADEDNGAIAISGPRGTTIQFTIRASIDLNTSTFLFTQLGSTGTASATSTSIRFIDSTIRITGATTGYRVDVPVRFIKKI